MVVGVVVFTVAYALIQTETGLAILTAPPPGIPDPYYVTAETKIYGDVVDLAAIKSKTGGNYSSDYTYVQWGVNPFYRVWVDNTLQEVYFGSMGDVMVQFSHSFAIENSLKGTYYELKNLGAIDPTSIMGKIYYFGNMPGSFIAYYVSWGSQGRTDYLNVTSSRWYAVAGKCTSQYGNGYVEVYLNDTICLFTEWLGVSALSSSGSWSTFYRWKINCVPTGSSANLRYSSVCLYYKDVHNVQTMLDNSNLRIYEVIDSPGVGFVSKNISPSSTVVSSTVNVTVRFDPPSADNMNITDLYPTTFTWASVDVLLEKFKVGTGLEESAYVNVVPALDGSNMKFTVYYNQAPSILQSLQSDEYVYLTYSLRVPDVAGEYTLPSASMVYLIPTPSV